jgi:pimeloyl-ACP methyl ester carboxylesterase
MTTSAATVRPFTSAIPDADIAELRERLQRTRWPSAQVSDWSDGTDLGYLRGLCDHWASGFDWRKQEARLNAFPQVRVRLGEHEIHALHVEGKGPAPMPLVLTHGWPGSVFEMLDILPRLTDPASFGGDPRDAFDVVVPSLPGYGFSSAPTKPGTSPSAIAALWIDLMSALGYQRFAAQGGDWGGIVSTCLGIEHPDRLIGVHLNFLGRVFLPSRASLGAAATAEETGYFDASDRWLKEEAGYSHLHETKPQTVAYALNDSPAGLAAYITEKFRSWSDCGGDLERAISRDVLLANVSLYWFTRSIGSSVHLYWERQRAKMRPPAQPPTTPFAVARFPGELGGAVPRSLVERVLRVEHWTDMPRGGHFAALEQPELLASDVAAFFRALR